MKRLYLAVSLLMIISSVSLVPIASVSAHRSGCHRWHSCPSDTGSYVCGDLGYTSECPTSYISTPSTPVITTRNETVNETVPFANDTKYIFDEYVGYSKVVQEGVNGSTEVTTPITYTDNSETSRGAPQKTIKTQPISKVTLVGARIKPEATIQSVTKTKKKEKYNISGTYKANSEVVLSVNNKKIKRAKTGRDGKFVFREVKIKKNDVEMKIYKREKRKENQVSELTFVDLSKLKITTEYQKLHNKK